jgi:predicted small secreted protein
MKKSLFFFAILLVGSALLSSCNKKLKKDIEELEKQVSDLQNQQNNTNAVIGANEPITATTTFIDDDGNTRTVTATYSFKAGDYSTQYMEDNGDGTYNVYIERFSDVDWNEGAWVYFNYDPATGAITNKSGGQYWDWQLSYNGYVYYSDSYSPPATINITINSITMNNTTNTANISLTFSANASVAYGNNVTWAVPNPGEETNTSFTFNGKLKIFPLD